MTFFLIAALVYFSMHALVWARAGKQLAAGRRVRFSGWLIALLLTFTPFLAHFIPATWPQPPVRLAWWLVYLWVGIIFYLFWLNLVAFVQDLNPDLVLFAGDQINDHPEWLAPKAQALSGIAAPLGKFGVVGNHEFYVGVQTSRDFHELAGIRLLRNQTRVLPDSGIQLVGVDDPAWGYRDRGFTARQLEKLAPDLLPDHFTLLIAHRPWGWEEQAVPLGIDLQLSGHTHGGQIFPFNWLVRLHYDHVAGHFEKEGRHLFVSTGTFGWGPPLRVGTRPQIAVIELVRQNG